MSTQSYWRTKAAEVIGRVLAEQAGKSEAEIRKALQDAYPFGPRRYHPYKIWLDEVRRQTGKSPKWPTKPDLSKLAEWEAIYGKRTA